MTTTIFSPARAADRGLSGSIELGLAAQGGNTDKLDLTNKNQAGWVTEHATLAGTASIRYGELKDVKNTQELTGSVNYDYYPWKHWSVFAFATALNNPFRDIRVRASAALGGKWTPFTGDKGSLSLSVAGIREFDEFNSDRSQSRAFKFSWRTKGELKLKSGAKLTHVTFLVQDFEKPFENYRVDSDTGITAPLSGWVSLRALYELNYENRPRPGIETTDRRVSTSLLLSWK